WVATQPKGKAGEWEDFERVAERMAPHQGLREFFKDWLQRPGYARLSFAPGRAPYYEAGQVHLRLAFTGQPFRMPLDIMLQYEDGTRSFQTVDSSSVKVGATWEISISVAKRPVLVSVDPWLRAVRDVHSDERLMMLQRGPGRAGTFIDPAHPDYL